MSRSQTKLFSKIVTETCNSIYSSNTYHIVLLYLCFLTYRSLILPNSYHNIQVISPTSDLHHQLVSYITNLPFISPTSHPYYQHPSHTTHLTLNNLPLIPPTPTHQPSLTHIINLPLILPTSHSYHQPPTHHISFVPTQVWYLVGMYISFSTSSQTLQWSPEKVTEVSKYYLWRVMGCM